MKKLVLLCFIVTSSLFHSSAQGLEQVIVETYYISNANDATVNSTGGVLPVGSVTYRVFLDMLPDYIFQSAYGDPNHECRIETSTLFFNNEDRGAVHPTFSFNYCDDNTVMLDSWLSVGAACNGRFGVLKADDDGVGTVINSDGVLQNNDPLMGIPLTQQDGLLLTASSPEPVITVGIGNEITVFDAQNDGTNGPVFSTYNGAWASVNGSSGADPAINRVLLMQITTDGVFSFKLNVQIRNQITLAVENYVADSALGNEIYFPTLNYNSSTVSLNESAALNPTFGLYPVPARDYTTLTMNVHGKDQKVSYSIYNLLGNRVAFRNLGKLNGTTSHVIDLSQMASGIYFVELDVDGFRSSKKLVIQ
jgi:hypothetical protein